MTIQLFTAASSDVAHVLANNTVEVMGGNPSTGQADAVWIGTLELAASQANATLEARPGGDNALGFLDANLGAQTIPFAIVAGSVNTCGVPPALPLDANEECNDGNTVSGDGCYRNCQLEDLFRLEGTATQNGNIEIVLETETIVTPTVTGETAPQVVANAVLLINANATLTVSAEAVGPGDTAVSDGSFVSVISNTQGIDLPEPGGIMLLLGIAFLLIVGRKRIKS